ncbi:ubiquitin-conjugating enzyme E2 O [Pseudohyphozyma bogoriensis]|nr:ubiquitin-conjugating enzyme E2 O [Pseudohyphozyma bogoriensis]
MPPASAPLPASSVYTEDIVKLTTKGREDTHAVVIRCWADEQPGAAAEALRLGIPYTPLEPGEIEILLPDGKREVIVESDSEIVDRGFIMGDLVRVVGAKGKAQAGIVTEMKTEIRLQRVLSGEKVDEWIESEKVVASARVARGDHVAHGEWVGIVEEVFEMAMVETEEGLVRRICDIGSTLSVGNTGESLLLDRVTFPPAGDLKRVIEVRHVVLAVNWLCMSQLSDVPPEQRSWERPKRYWTDLDQLCLVRSTADHLHSVGDKVVLRDHGTTTTRPTTAFEHCLNLDEDVDVFPGDVGVYAANNKVAVVQSMDARKRTIKLRWLTEDGKGVEGEVETVSALEFDPHGAPPEVYGVRRQDFVMIAKEGEGNGVPLPTVPRLGESENLTGNFPSAEGLRVELSAIGLQYASTLGDDRPPVLPKSGTETSHINWYGEVLSLLLDGTVLVRFPSGVEQAFPLNRVYHLDDGLDDGMGGGGPIDDGEGSEKSWATESGDVDMEDEEEEGGWAEEDEEGDEIVVDEIVLPDEEQEMEDEKEGDGEDAKVIVAEPKEVEDPEDWQRFVVLEESPKDHHYAKETIQQPSKSYMARIKKEYNVLSSSLPPNILVRAYEDRADLLRCLIIGPLGTPFQNAPFLFDIFLPPSKFPFEPPQVFFHSWAGGTRVSPNLYAEGKVCLSLLGTWSGEKSESWSGARSSILQILISIQSLIMVEQPYYTEPGFEKQSSTIEGQTASDLYNERTFVLTRAFVNRAVEYPPTSFGAEIKAYYFTGLPNTGPGALKGIAEQAKKMLEESEAFHKEKSEEEEEGERKRPPSAVLPEMKVLTEGACLSLKRTLKGLGALEVR